MKFRMIVGLVLAMVSASVFASPKDRVFEQTLELDGVTRVLIDGGVGTIDVRASEDDKLHVVVTAEPDDDDLSKSPSEEDMAAIELDVDRTSRRIKLELDLPGGMDVDDVQEKLSLIHI